VVDEAVAPARVRRTVVASHAPSRHATSRYLGFLLPVTILVLWQVLASVDVIDPTYFPPPSAIAATAYEMLGNGALMGDVAVTLARVLQGFVIGGVLGYAVGMLTGVFLLMRRILEPTLSAVYTIPKLALLPIFLTVFGFGEAPKIAIIGVTVFFYVWIYTMEAVVQIPPGYLDAARSFGVSRWQEFVHVLLPGTLPSVFTALRVAIAVGVLVTISAEFLIGDSGLGYLIFHSRSLFRMEESYVGILAVALVGFALQAIVVFIGTRVTPWSRSEPVASVKVQV
jgi:sulfonate transport system permease protein